MGTDYKLTYLQDYKLTSYMLRKLQDYKLTSYMLRKAVRLHAKKAFLRSLVAHKGPADICIKWFLMKCLVGLGMLLMRGCICCCVRHDPADHQRCQGHGS